MPATGCAVSRVARPLRYHSLAETSEIMPHHAPSAGAPKRASGTVRVPLNTRRPSDGTPRWTPFEPGKRLPERGKVTLVGSRLGGFPAELWGSFRDGCVVQQA